VSTASLDIVVDDATFFHPGDNIQIGANVGKIASKSGNTLTMVALLSATASDPIFLYDYVLGKVVNIGAK